ncbi:MAG: ParA family partition ATPase [Pseudomonadota bacterium]
MLRRRNTIVGIKDMAGQVVCIVQQKGGAGKTTLVSNIATALLAEGKKVALFDTDPQGSLGKWLDEREATIGETESLIFATATAFGISRALRGVADKADFILIDTPPKADSDMRWVLTEADLVLIPVAASRADVWATQDVIDLADRADRSAHIVLNRMRAGTRVSDDVTKAVAELEAKPLKASLANRVVYAEALGRGLGVVEAQKNSAAADEVRALTKEVIKLLRK